MTRYFLADPHFGHEGIIRMMARVSEKGRLFSCSEEHDAFLLDQINAAVGRDDELIIVGDFADDSPGKYRAKIKCRHIRFVLGNHDRKQKTANVFGEIPEVIRTRVSSVDGRDHIKLFVTHYPGFYWDGSHRGWGHVYGHTHGQREEYLDMLEPQRRAMDVGVDNVYRLYGYYGPISEIKVYEYMARRSGHDDVRFYHDYQADLYQRQGLL